MSSNPSQPRRFARDHEARIVPGDIVDERYRMVALLGRGGMGEVWRAEDVELDQEVALKFLPSSLMRDDAARERFLDEVRLARLVSHPNVCRVHDVGGRIAPDADASPGSVGVKYITMEYVQGEDLSSLLRRVGRVPEERAVEISRELCAGLAAAHAQGLIHRDLKPANILIDARGSPRIADFGLSAVASELMPDDARVGTPRYMAPEQLRGEGVSVRSDIFSLGLVLFELFTGKGAFQGSTLDELMHAHDASRPDARAHVATLDPAIDALLRRCLARDPDKRPRSAHEVAAALPGGDPLAAALAAGETPSPELIAASGGVGALRPRTAAALALLVATLLTFAAWADEQRKLLALVEPELSEPVLRQRALDIARSMGLYGPEMRPLDQQGRVVERVRRDLFERDSDDPWRALAHPWSESVRYWWRGSDAALDPLEHTGIVGWDDPPPSREGDVRVILGHDGRLLAFDATPRKELARLAGEAPPRAPFDWGPALAAAKVDRAALEPAPPTFLARTDNDAKVTWIGAAPGIEGATLRVGGASLGARPVHFSLLVDWHRPPVERSGIARGLRLAFDVSVQIVGAITMLGGLWLGVRNLRAGRGDLRGGRRLALGVLAVRAVVWSLTAHHAAGFLHGLWYAFPHWLFEALLVGALYVALEPTVRREWPQRLVTWQRLLSGQFDDTAVARDVLLGVAAGLCIHALMVTNWLCASAIGDPSAIPALSSSASLASLRSQLGELLEAPLGGVQVALFVPFLYALALKLTKRHVVASLVLAFIALVRMPYAVISAAPWLDLSFRGAQVLILLAVLHRAGLVALFACFTVLQCLPAVTCTLSFDPWYSSAWQLLLGAFALITLWAALRSSHSRAVAPRRSGP